MSKGFLDLLIGICLVLGLMLVYFGTTVLAVCGLALLILVAWILIPRHRNAPMARRTKVEKGVYRRGVERRKRFGLKMSVRPNWFKRKRELPCPVMV